MATSAARKIIFTPTLTSAAGGCSSASSSHLASKSEQYLTNKLPRLQQPAVDDISNCYQVSLQPRPALFLSLPLPLFLSSSSASHTHTHCSSSLQLRSSLSRPLTVIILACPNERGMKSDRRSEKAANMRSETRMECLRVTAGMQAVAATHSPVAELSHVGPFV